MSVQANNGLELTKPAQATQLRSSTQCWAGTEEVDVADGDAREAR